MPKTLAELIYDIHETVAKTNDPRNAEYYGLKTFAADQHKEKAITGKLSDVLKILNGTVEGMPVGNFGNNIINKLQQLREDLLTDKIQPKDVLDRLKDVVYLLPEDQKDAFYKKLKDGAKKDTQKMVETHTGAKMEQAVPSNKPANLIFDKILSDKSPSQFGIKNDGLFLQKKNDGLVLK